MIHLALDVDAMKAANMTDEEIEKILSTRKKQQKQDLIDTVEAWTETTALSDRMVDQDFDFSLTIKKEGESAIVIVKM